MNTIRQLIFAPLAKRATACLALALAFAMGNLAIAVPAHAVEQYTAPLLMVVVEFDNGTNDGQAHYADEIDWNIATFSSEGSLSSFYYDISGDVFSFAPVAETSSSGTDGNHCTFDRANDGVVHITLPEPHGSWGLVNERYSIAQEFGQVVLRAFQASSAYVDYGSFDTNGDGVLSTDELVICFCIAGYDASSVEDPSRTDVPLVWPHAGKLANTGRPSEETDGVRLDSYLAIPELMWYDTDPIELAEQEPLGVLYHELGHYLGLPDLYALNSNPEAEAWGAFSVGALSLMDNGGWAAIAEGAGYRYVPMALDAWSRYVLGWNMPQVVTQSGDYAVCSQLSEHGYQSLLIPTSNPEQYYLIENRQPEDHDEAIIGQYSESNPRGGIVIWHIDKGTYRAFGTENTANDTTHRPAIMETYWERSVVDGSFSLDWANSRPDTSKPFFDAYACEANLGDQLASISLPLYSTEPGNDIPSSRVDSGIRLQFPTASSRDMTVHVQLPTETVSTSGESYLIEDAKAATTSLSSPLGNVACAALMRETGAKIAVVAGDDLAAGLPDGELSLQDVYGALPSDSVISCYQISGENLVQMLEQTLQKNADGGEGSPYAVGGVSCSIDWSKPSGERLSDVAVNGVELNPTDYYQLAVTHNVASRSEVLRGTSPDLSLLWGSPADALRTFIQGPNWEEEARQAAGEKTIVKPATPELRISNGEEGELALPVVPLVIAIVAIGAIALGALVTIRARR